MSLVAVYALGRAAFGGLALIAPATTGRMIAGEAAAAADAQAFLRGMGGRELGIALGLARAERTGAPVAPWLVAGVLADCGDVAGIALGWRELDPGKRSPGLAMAAAAAIAGLEVLRRSSRL